MVVPTAFSSSLAMKCNPHPVLMDLMCSLPGMCIDCASVEEIQACLDRGIHPDHIIFANPVKAVESIDFMRKHNVWTGTVDSAEEIEKMHKVLGEDSKKCNVVIRLWVDDSHSVIALGSKFGCQLEEVRPILERAKAYGMQAVGVAFHVGTGNSDFYAYEKAIANAHEVFEMAKDYGFAMNLLDLGGGWSGDLGDAKHENPSLSKVHEIIDAALNKYHFREIPNFRMISEPGRYFNNHTISIACEIVNVVKREDRVVYQINEGVMGVFHDVVLCGMDFVVKPLVEGEMHPSSIMGTSHRPIDVIEKDISLPLMKIGDYILFNHIGAYSVSLTAVPHRQSQEYVFFVRKSSLTTSK